MFADAYLCSGGYVQSCLVVETWSQNNVTRENDPCVFGSLLIRPVKAIFGAEHTMNKLSS